MQKVIPTSFGGGEGEERVGDDYSSWTFTYSEDYHLITEGTNELTSKISCENSPSNITKSYSVNVTGVGIGRRGQQQQQLQQKQSSTSEEEQGEGETTTSKSSEITSNDDNTPFTLPLPSKNPGIENKQPSGSQQENDINPKQDEPNIYWDID
jgi:hypothetical protein